MLICCDIPFSENIFFPSSLCSCIIQVWTARLKETALKAGGERGTNENENVPGLDLDLAVMWALGSRKISHDSLSCACVYQALWADEQHVSQEYKHKRGDLSFYFRLPK